MIFLALSPKSGSAFYIFCRLIPTSEIKYTELRTFRKGKNMKRILSLVLSLLLALSMLTACGDGVLPNGDDSANVISAVSDDGRYLANRGTATVDGVADDEWKYVEALDIAVKDRLYVSTSATLKTLWDDENLYLLVSVTDSDVQTLSDSVEIFIDSLWDKSKEYEADDLCIEVYPDGNVTVHNGTLAYTAATNVTDSGYVVEAAIALDEQLCGGLVLGLDVRVNDYAEGNTKKGTLNLYDTTDRCEITPEALGELILGGERANPIAVSCAGIDKIIDRFETGDYSSYGRYENIAAALITLKDISSKDLTATEVVSAMEYAHDVEYNLVDASSFPEVSELEYNADYPDPFVFLDGSEMSDASDWESRRKEISDMYQYYMYGVWRDGTDEIVTYDYDNGTLTVYIERISTGAKTQFTATVMMPDKSIEMPSENGYPVVVGMHAGISEATANANGFATITLDWFAYGIASDDTKHTGAFYDLYPYGDSWQDQTGVLLAWSWGCSKILDALEAGLGEELGIDPTASIVTGVSRWGKAAAVCGAYESRFTMAAPSCSGAGGLALFRYTSEGKTYDFSSKGESSAYKYGTNEPLGSLQASGEAGWFNSNFKKLKSVEYMPFDQYMLASLVANENRYLFIIGSCVWEDWVNAPAMWYTYLAAREIYTTLGLEDHIKINIHTSGHAVIEEDMQYMTEYFKQMVYGIEPTSDLGVLDSSVFALDENSDGKMEGFTSEWIHNFF